VTAGPSTQPVLWGFIDAILASTVRIPSGSGKTIYRYTITYDDAQLLDGCKLLTCHKIGGIFCKSCLTEWIEDLVGQAVTLAGENGVYTLTNQYGCTFTIDVSPPALICSDTETVDLTCGVDGSGNYTIEGDVIISPEGDNILIADGTGLYVPPPAIQGVDVGAGCAGVGPSQMVRSFTLAGGIITIESAPEHTIVGQGGTRFDTDVNQTGVLSVGLTNPSSCRSMLVQYTHEWGLTYTQTTTSGNPTVDLNTNGGGFLQVVNLPAVDGATWNGNYANSGGTGFTTIGPGVTLTETRQLQVNAPGGGGLAAAKTWGQALILIGTTV
jgi:hypothetical protein